QLRVVFLAVMVLLASTFGCVAWWLLKQDQLLATQRVVERQDSAAELAVGAIKNQLSRIDQKLSRIVADGGSHTAESSDDAVFVRIEGSSIRVWPDTGLVYYLIVRQSAEVPDAIFAAVDGLEFQNRDYAGAISALKELAVAQDSKIRAAALALVGSNQRK